jgi:hypothetical protein
MHGCSKGSIQDWHLQMTKDSKNSDCKCPLAFKKTQFFILKNTFPPRTSYIYIPLKKVFTTKSHLFCKKKL